MKKLFFTALMGTAFTSSSFAFTTEIESLLTSPAVKQAISEHEEKMGYATDMQVDGIKIPLKYRDAGSIPAEISYIKQSERSSALKRCKMTIRWTYGNGEMDQVKVLEPFTCNKS